jgi:hypothetical protein
VFLERTATEAFWQDLFLLIPPLVMCFIGRTESRSEWPSWRFWIGVFSGLLVVLYTVLVVGLPADNDTVPPGVEQAAEEGFPPVDGYALLVDGVEDAEAEVFEGREALQFVILSLRIPGPLVLDLRQNEVFSVTSDAVTRGASGGVDLDFSQAKSQGSFELGAGGLAFSALGHTFELQSR